MADETLTQDGVVAVAEPPADQEAQTLPEEVRGPEEQKSGFWWGTGRRKTSVARVRIRDGSGLFQVNGKALKDFFRNEQDRIQLLAPLQATQSAEKYDVHVKVLGGGMTGQAGAVRMGLARALLCADPSMEPALRSSGYLTRDSRMKERKKYGQRGARRRFQFSKR